jgi:hypothetical protein
MTVLLKTETFFLLAQKYLFEPAGILVAILFWGVIGIIIGMAYCALIMTKAAHSAWVRRGKKKLQA